jgi:hypothetical protein
MIRRTSKPSERGRYPADEQLGEAVNVAVSKSWQTEDGGWRKVSIGLNWYDLVKLVGEKKVEGYHIAIIEDEVRIVDDSGTEMPLVDQYKVVEAQADLLLMYQRVVDGFPKELAAAEMRKIRERVPILKGAILSTRSSRCW